MIFFFFFIHLKALQTISTTKYAPFALDRFDLSYDDNRSGGYRDLSLNIEVSPRKPLGGGISKVNF